MIDCPAHDAPFVVKTIQRPGFGPQGPFVRFADTEYGLVDFRPVQRVPGLVFFSDEPGKHGSAVKDIPDHEKAKILTQGADDGFPQEIESQIHHFGISDILVVLEVIHHGFVRPVRAGFKGSELAFPAPGQVFPDFVEAVLISWRWGFIAE